MISVQCYCSLLLEVESVMQVFVFSNDVGRRMSGFAPLYLTYHSTRSNRPFANLQGITPPDLYPSGHKPLL